MLKQAEETDGLSLPQIHERHVRYRAMREHRAELEAQYKDQLSFFKPGYPEMTKLKAQIDEIDRQIKAAVDVVKESLRAEYEAAKAQEESLQRRARQAEDGGTRS